MTFSVFVAAEVNPDFKSESIMEFTKAKYSHAGVLVENTIYHATAEGVHTTPLAEFLADHYLVHCIGLSKFIERSDYAIGWLDGSIGKDYSESQLLGIVLKPFRKYLGDGKREMICSEFAARFLDECSTIPIFDHVDVDFIDPVQFIEAVLKFMNQKQGA